MAEAFKKAVKDSITLKYATLRKTLEGSMESFAENMYQARLINSEALRSQKYETIMEQFISGMSYKHSISEIQKHCQLFAGALEELGGPVEMASNELTREWTALIPQQLTPSVIPASSRSREERSHPYQSICLNVYVINVLLYDFLKQKRVLVLLRNCPLRNLNQRQQFSKNNFIVFT